MGTFEVAIVIPAYNEENTIEAVVKSIKAHGTAIVVNDGSTDKTSEIAENKYKISVLLKKQLSDNKLPNIPYTSTSKIQEKFSWKNEYDIDSVFEKMFEELKKT